MHNLCVPPEFTEWPGLAPYLAACSGVYGLIHHQIVVDVTVEISTET